jgi:thioredoxin 1
MNSVRFNRRVALVAFGLSIAAAPMVLAQSAQNPGKPFSQAAFDAAQAAGKPVLIEVTAPWCPTCKAQKPILSALKAKYANVEIFEVDFDTQKPILQKFKATQQSTLIAFKGKSETGRSVGDTTPAGIEKLMQSAI